MDFYGDDRKLSELGGNDFHEFLEEGVFSPENPAAVNGSLMDAYGMDNDWLDSFFTDPVLNDRMMSDALQPPHIQSEHSYSLSNADHDEDTSLNIKAEPMDKDLDSDLLNTPLNLSINNGSHTPKKSRTLLDENISTVSITQANTGTTLLKQPAIILATTTTAAQPTSSHITQLNQETLVIPRVNIKLEPPDVSPAHSTESYDSLGLPPTPPSSSNSDSEGGQSPQRSAPSSPVRHPNPLRQQVRSLSQHQPLFTNPIPQSGVLILTEEEKRTLITEGYPIPNKLPLTKQEEKNLKKIRRKIKNKISAQESRRKKKEYLETLEKRVEAYNQENNDLKKKVENLETNNRSLLSQLQKLQTLAGKLTRPSAATTTQTGTCLMVLVLCFAVFLGSWSPMSFSIGYSQSVSAPAIPAPSGKLPLGPEVKDVMVDAYSTPNKRSRVLLSVNHELEDEAYGPVTPFSYYNIFTQFFHSASQHIGQGESLKVEPPMPQVDVLQMTREVNLQNETDKVVQLQASMHPDIAANVTANILAMDQRQMDTTA